jgi:UDP-N-acetylglucosamine 2-epimerase
MSIMDAGLAAFWRKIPVGHIEGAARNRSTSA